jgi:hypothetical protein
MDNLVFSCTDALTQATTPSCTTDYGERVVKIILMKESDLTAWRALVSSDVPTAAEFTTGVASDYLTVIDGISNGHRIEQSATELSGDDTISGGTERYDVTYRIEGRLKLIDESVNRMVEKLTRYSILRAWFITEKDYCFGGESGYKASPDFGAIIFEGKGTPNYIPFFLDYTATGADYAAYDDDYTALTNS